MAKLIEDSFWIKPACEGEEKRTFKCEKQRDLWIKLHCKKCQICEITRKRQNGIRHYGIEHFNLDGTTPQNFSFQQEEITRTETRRMEIGRAMMN